MYKITTEQINNLVALSYGNKEALSILRDIKQTNPKRNKKGKTKPKSKI